MIKTTKKIEQLRNGWTAHIQMAFKVKKDGTIDKRIPARPTGLEVHTHPIKRTRVYRDNVIVR